MWYCPTPRRTVADPIVVLSDNKSNVNANISNDHIPEARCDQSSYATHETFHYFIFPYGFVRIYCCTGTIQRERRSRLIYRWFIDLRPIHVTAARSFDYPTRSFVHSCPAVIFTRPVVPIAIFREIAFCCQSRVRRLTDRENTEKATSIQTASGRAHSV